VSVSAGTGAASARDLHERIILAVAAGEQLSDVDRELIEPAVLLGDDTAAPWLVAWGPASTATACRQRRHAIEPGRG
jgi:uncharacterized protein (DUF697 family)